LDKRSILPVEAFSRVFANGSDTELSGFPPRVYPLGFAKMNRNRFMRPVSNIFLWGAILAWHAESMPTQGEEIFRLPPVSSTGQVLAPWPVASLSARYGRGQNRPEPAASESGSEKGPSEPVATAADADPADETDADNQKEEAKEEAEEKPPRLLGERFHGRGPVAFEYLYTGEILSNTRGGIRTRRATRYEGLLDLAMDVELEKIRPRLPGKVHLLFQHTHGRGLSLDFVGDAQILSTIDSYGNITQVSKYWWETTLGEDLLTIRLGKQDVNDEFHLVEMAADFIHSAAGIPATLPAPTYPDNSVAAVVLVKLTESLSAKAGIWDGYPNGATWGFSNTGTTFTIVELERKHRLGGWLPGVIDFGFSHRSPVDVRGDLQPEQYTMYCDLEQVLYREDPSDEKNEQGLGVFFRYHTDFPRTETQCKNYLAAGLVYRGLLPRRDEDRLGVAVYHLQHNLGGTGRETATELFYKVQWTPWMTLQPVLQYISSPSGVYRDSFVVGLRFQIVM
jgi:porin